MRERQVSAIQPASDFAFEVGQYFRSGVTVFQIREFRGKHIVIEHAKSLERRYITEDELAQGYLAGNILPCGKDAAVRAITGDAFPEDDSPAVVVDGVSTLSDAAQAAGHVRIKYITALQNLGYTSLRPTPLLEIEYRRLATKFGDDIDKLPALSTMYSTSQKIARMGGDLRAGYPNFAGRGGRGKTRIHPVAAAQLDEILRSIDTNPKERIRYRNVEGQLLRGLIDEHGREAALLMMPSSSTVTRCTKKIFGAYEICRRNNGKAAADKKFRTWYPRDKAQLPLEVVEFDDKDTRVFGIDERTGLPVGRIFLTAGVDQCSTVPLGFSISDKPRNTWSAINALASCVLPKDVSAPEWRDVTSDVPYYGSMGIAVFDNALYNHAKVMQASVSDVTQRAAVQFANPYTPTEKAVVENFNGRMVSDFLPELPGFAGQKDFRDRLQEGLIAANLTIADFKLRFLSWVYDDYCNKPRGDGITPRQIWESGTFGFKQRLPADINRILLATMPSQSLRLRPELILFTGLNYQNSRLAALRRGLGHNALVTFKYHPERLESIFVLDPIANEWFEVLSSNLEYTKHLCLRQHKLIRKMARDSGIRNPSIEKLLEHRQKLTELVAQARWSKKLKDRKFAARHSVDPLSRPVQSTITVTDLESQIIDVDSVELEIDDECWNLPEFC